MRSSDRPGQLDRRTFLKATAFSAAGLAALAAFPTDADAATTDAISLGNRINQLVVAEHGASWNWAGQCQRAQYYAEWAARGSESGLAAYGSALLSYKASHIDGTDMATAPAGSFSYFAYPTYGHVVTNIGNGYCINTSSVMTKASLHDFGHGLYISPLAGYPYAYRGWSYANGTNPQIALSAWSPPGGGGASGSNWAFNPPVASVQQRIQAALKRRGRYSGPVNGIWGVNSIKGIQTTCHNVGYDGPINGVPGYNTCHYVQVYAARFGGYTGPINSILGPHSWEGFAEGLEKP